MERKTLVWIGVFVGGSLGGFIPTLWGASSLSLSSVLLTAVGGLLGIWVGFKLGS
jgi:hypothetical protein